MRALTREPKAIIKTGLIVLIWLALIAGCFFGIHLMITDAAFAFAMARAGLMFAGPTFNIILLIVALLFCVALSAWQDAKNTQAGISHTAPNPNNKYVDGMFKWLGRLIIIVNVTFSVHSILILSTTATVTLFQFVFGPVIALIIAACLTYYLGSLSVELMYPLSITISRKPEPSENLEPSVAASPGATHAVYGRMYDIPVEVYVPPDEDEQACLSEIDKIPLVKSPFLNYQT